MHFLNRPENRRFSLGSVCLAVIHAVKANGRRLYPSAFIPSSQAADGPCPADSKLLQWSRDGLMVISTSSARSSGDIFLSEKDEIVLFLTVRDVLEHLSPCAGSSKLALCYFSSVPSAGAARGLSVFTQERSALAMAVKLLSGQRSPISLVFLSSFLIFSTWVALSY